MIAYSLPAVAWLVVLAMILRDARHYERTHPLNEPRFEFDGWK
jgi:hypothetical protein